MRFYRVFTDYNASFIVKAEDIEYSEGRLKAGLEWARTTEGFIMRFIRTVEGDYLNVDHILRITPMREGEKP